MSAEATCAICGRTILAGERVHGFLDTAEERSVCELCVARAERLGWRSAGEPEPEESQAGHDGRWRLRGLLRGRDRRPGAPRPVAVAQLQPPADPEGAGEAEPQSDAEAEPQLPSPPSRPDPAAAPRRARPTPPPDYFEAPTPFQRAVARFNSSEADRTVAGLTRTLGKPWVSVGAAAGAAEEVRITVAWELSWYQWGIDIGDELRPVFQIDKGREIAQLDAAARQWNASVAEDGQLSLAAEPAAKR